MSADLVGGFYVGEVEADSQDEAEELGRQLADAKGVPTVCHHCQEKIDALELGEEIYVAKVEKPG